LLCAEIASIFLTIAAHFSILLAIKDLNLQLLNEGITLEKQKVDTTQHRERQESSMAIGNLDAELMTGADAPCKEL
jgi:hypothetical protein